MFYNQFFPYFIVFSYQIFFFLSFSFFLNCRGIIFEIPTPLRLEKAEKKAMMRKLNNNRNVDINNNEDEKDNDINESQLLELKTEKILIENNRREKESAVIAQNEKYPDLRDGEMVDEELYHNLLCASFIETLKKLIDEIRGSQIYVDGEGIVTKRLTAKTALRKVDKVV